MNQRDLMTVAGVAGLIGIAGLFQHARAKSATPQPRLEVTGMTSFPLWHPGDTVGGVQDHVGYQWRTQGNGLVASRHRYPQGCGSNVSAVIHDGFTPLNIPAPQDDDWFRNPPSDAMW